MRTIRILMICMLFFSIASAAYAQSFEKGDTGTKVAVLQLKLRELGYRIDKLGTYDTLTVKAVKTFQKKSGLKSTGKVDEQTYQLIINHNHKDKLNARDVRGIEVVAVAKKYLGVPYCFGGTTPAGFDCSGFVQFVYKEQGKYLPRMVDDQYKLGQSITRLELQAGDVVFFTTYLPGASHEGIYIGDNHFIHASASRGVMISTLEEAYWKTKYLGAKRI